MTADGSFAICNEREEDGRYLGLWDKGRGEGTQPRLMGNYDIGTPEAWATGGRGAFAVSKKAGAVGIRALEGEAGERKANLVNADPNSNLVESRTTIPTLQGTVRKGEKVWYVSAIYAKPPPSGKGAGVRRDLDGWEKQPEIPGWLREEIEKSVGAGSKL